MPEGFEYVDTDELSPDPALIVDEESELAGHALPIPPVPVAQEGPVFVRQLPMQFGRPVPETLDASVRTLLGDDPRRAYVLLMAPLGADPGFIVSTDRATVDQELLAMWPVQRVLRLDGPGKIYAKAAGASCRITVVPVFWAN